MLHARNHNALKQIADDKHNEADHEDMEEQLRRIPLPTRGSRSSSGFVWPVLGRGGVGVLDALLTTCLPSSWLASSGTWHVTSWLASERRRRPIRSVTVSWDPGQYLHYEDERERPFVELLARIDHADPHEIVDLGCGTRNHHLVNARPRPHAHIVGIDSSAEMIAPLRRASDAPGRLEFRQGDLRDWVPDGAVDVIITNATLQWVPDQAPARLLTNRGRSASWSGTHCRVAFVMRTSTVPSGTQSRRSPWRNSSRPGTVSRSAWAIISRRAVDADDVGVGPAPEHSRGGGPGSAAEIDDLMRIGMVDPGPGARRRGVPARPRSAGTGPDPTTRSPSGC